MKHLPQLLVATACFVGIATYSLSAAPVDPHAIADSTIPLSDAVKAHIAAMTPLFNGTSLAGWSQHHNYGGGDIRDAAALVRKLGHPEDPVSAFLARQVDAPTAEVLFTHEPDVSAQKKQKSALAGFLTRVVAGPSIYDSGRFAGVTLRPETEALRRTQPSGAALVRLNRMLLEDAYRTELATTPLTDWIVKDGAIASVGAGRGVICTDQDFTRYRLIFQMRHVSGKPDHQPCVLVFCQRPAAGQPPLDALGGIQFQVPNGGHWDYRPGHNNGGTSFQKVTPTHFNNGEWCQVELLVDAQTGSARMAVAQHPGMRGVENLDFHEPGAGRTGPFALQMHNAGLFDEYKDVRIEPNPPDDRLITAQ